MPTHAEIAANARAPYARRIAEDTRIIEILADGLREIAMDSTDENARATARRILDAGLNEFLRESFRA